MFYNVLHWCEMFCHDGPIEKRSQSCGKTVTLSEGKVYPVTDHEGTRVGGGTAKSPAIYLAGGGAIPDRCGKLCLREGLNAEHSNP